MLARRTASTQLPFPISFLASFSSGIKTEFQTVLAEALANKTVELEDFDLTTEFTRYPRRDPRTFNASDTATDKPGDSFIAASAKATAKKIAQLKALPGLVYLKKLSRGSKIFRGLQVKETPAGPRIAVISAAGGISTGKSSKTGLNGQTLGSDSLIAQVRQAKADSGVKAVVIRVDSPGGSALASDLMWREIRQLARVKPVVASMVNVAASGGYYISMACDYILAEELTITGSIGVVTSKFNVEELNKRIGYGVETVSKGRYAEVLSSSRGFTAEEEQYFADGAVSAYTSFITKAAASRGMTLDAMQQVAQGRVWTGRQALEVGLVDEIGGLWSALNVASKLAGLPQIGEKDACKIEMVRDRSSGFGLPFGLRAQLPGVRNTLSAEAKIEDVYSGMVNEASPSLGSGSIGGILTKLLGVVVNNDEVAINAFLSLFI